jgi:hypothetical protein
MQIDKIILTTFRGAYESLDQIFHLVNAWKESELELSEKRLGKILEIAGKGLSDFKR